MVSLRVMEVTAITFFFTVTEQVADLPPQEAVIVAVPSLLAVMVPLFTDATLELDEVHVTVLSVALLGLTVAVIV